MGRKVHAPAKINLFLEVLSKRGDGFHEIETLIAPVSLYDTLVMRAVSPVASDAAAITLDVDVTVGVKQAIPAGPENLAARAAELLRRRAGVPGGLAIRLIKRIPAGSGLGGGSSDAAAALIGANACWKLGWSRVQLGELAAELGSDVPFFFAGGAAICRGRGELVEPIGKLGGWHVVVAQPDQGLSTAEVYQRCELTAARRHVEDLRQAVCRDQFPDWRRYLHNRLQSAAATLLPTLKTMQHEFGRLDFLAHQMTGSGSAYFGICRHARHAGRLAATLRGRLPGSVYPLRLAC